MDTTIRFTTLPDPYHRWKIAEARCYDKDYMTSFGNFREIVFSLVNCATHCFNPALYEQELLNLCRQFYPAYDLFCTRYKSAHGDMETGDPKDNLPF